MFSKSKTYKLKQIYSGFMGKVPEGLEEVIIEIEDDKFHESENEDRRRALAQYLNEFKKANPKQKLILRFGNSSILNTRENQANPFVAAFLRGEYSDDLTLEFDSDAEGDSLRNLKKMLAARTLTLTVRFPWNLGNNTLAQRGLLEFAQKENAAKYNANKLFSGFGWGALGGPFILVGGLILAAIILTVLASAFVLPALIGILAAFVSSWTAAVAGFFATSTTAIGLAGSVAIAVGGSAIASGIGFGMWNYFGRYEHPPLVLKSHGKNTTAKLINIASADVEEYQNTYRKVYELSETFKKVDHNIFQNDLYDICMQELLPTIHREMADLDKMSNEKIKCMTELLKFANTAINNSDAQENYQNFITLSDKIEKLPQVSTSLRKALAITGIVLLCALAVATAIATGGAAIYFSLGAILSLSPHAISQVYVGLAAGGGSGLLIGSAFLSNGMKDKDDDYYYRNRPQKPKEPKSLSSVCSMFSRKLQANQNNLPKDQPTNSSEIRSENTASV